MPVNHRPVSMPWPMRTPMGRLSRPPSVSRSAGFTLTEIMIVVSIVGLLSTMALPQVAKARKRAQAVATVNDLRIFEDALNLYAMERGNFPLRGFPDNDFRLGEFPSPLDSYIDQKYWLNGAPCGGVYYWSGVPHEVPREGNGPPCPRFAIEIWSISPEMLTLIAEQIEGPNAPGGWKARTADMDGVLVYFLNPYTP